jgi:hypothetical protein
MYECNYSHVWKLETHRKEGTYRYAGTSYVIKRTKNRFYYPSKDLKNRFTKNWDRKNSRIYTYEGHKCGYLSIYSIKILSPKLDLGHQISMIDVS